MRPPVPVLVLVAGLLLAGPSAGQLALLSGDCGSGRDATSSNPVVVQAPGACEGQAADGDTILVQMGADAVLVLRVETSAHMSVVVTPAGWESYRWSVDADETIHIHVPDGDAHVQLWPSSTADYRLSFSLAPFAATPDCGGAGDVPDGSQGLPIAAGCAGVLDVGDMQDAYKLQHAAGKLTKVTLAAPADDLVGASVLTSLRPIALYDALGADGALAYAFADAGTTQFKIGRDAFGEARATPYALSVAEHPLPASDDCGLGLDLPWRGSPAPLVASDSCAGAIGAGDWEDTFIADTGSQYGRAVLHYAGAPVNLAVGATYPGFTTFGASQTVERMVDPGVPGLKVIVSPSRAPVDDALPYAVHWEVLPDEQDDCGLGHDAGASLGHLATITPPVNGVLVCDGHLDAVDWLDRYLVHADPGDFLEISPSWLRWGPPGAEPESRPSSLVHLAGPIVVQAVEDEPYTLRIDRASPALLDDCGAGRDVSAAAPLAVAPGAFCEGERTLRSDVSDDYVLELREGDVLTLSHTPNVRLTLVRPDGSSFSPPREVILDAVLGRAHLEPVVVTGADAGAWRIIVHAFGAGRHPYDVSFDGVFMR